MEKIAALFYLVCVWICIVELTATNDDDGELIQEVLDILNQPNIQSDDRSILSKKGTTNDVSDVNNRNRYSGRDIKKGFSHGYNSDKVRGTDIDDEIQALINELEEEERVQNQIETFLKSKRARSRFFPFPDDPSVRGTEATEAPTPTPPETPPPTMTTTTTTTTPKPVYVPPVIFCWGSWWGLRRRCRR